MADLELRKISKSFRGVRALVDADFSANRGEVHALLGENGAGKSTLIKVLSGALQPDRGEILLFGRPLRLSGPRHALREGIATVYQELSLIPDLTVAQNVFLDRADVLRAGTYSPRDLAARTLELLERTGLEGIDPEARVCDIPLAKRQMIEILKAVSKNPRVIILDEATSALSENRVEWLLTLARKSADAGAIVIFISHRLAEILHGCDRITVFRNGRNVGERTVEGTDMDEIVSLMLGRRIAGYFPERNRSERGEVMLETIGLRRGHELAGVDLRVHAGEVVGVGGLAGQGQMPLFMSLFGVLRAEGEIRIRGRKARLHSPHQSMQQGIALIPEDRATQGLILPFPIDFNISLAMLRRLRQGILLNRRREISVVGAFMRQFEIKAAGPSTLVMNLSGGNQQKVVLAKYLASDPQILLMYDITRGVDVGTKKEIFKLVRDLGAKGKGILFYSTDMDELVNVCDRVLVMHDGRIGACLEGDHLTKENIMIASIGGRPAAAAREDLA